MSNPFGSLFESWKTITGFLFFGLALTLSTAILQSRVITGLLGVLMTFVSSSFASQGGDRWIFVARVLFAGVAATFPLAFAGYFYCEENFVFAAGCLCLSVVFVVVAFWDAALRSIGNFFKDNDFVPDRLMHQIQSACAELVYVLVTAALFYWINTSMLLWSQMNAKVDARRAFNIFQMEFTANCIDTLDEFHKYSDYAPLQTNMSLMEQPLVVDLCLDLQQWDVRARYNKARLDYTAAMNVTNPFLRNPFRDYGHLMSGAFEFLDDGLTPERKTQALDFALAWLVWGPFLALANSKIKDYVQQAFAFAAILLLCYGWSWFAAWVRTQNTWMQIFVDVSQIPLTLV
jgi:hypothetical protein